MNQNRIVISEFALEQLNTYCNQSVDNLEKAQETIKLLIKEELSFEIIKVSGMNRPIWSSQVDSNNIIYYIHGYGAGEEEIRVIYFGITLQSNTEAIKRMLLLSGEITYNTLPDNIEVEEKFRGNSKPILPSRVMNVNTNLNTFLNPSEDDLFENLEKTPQNGDDLNGQPYRILMGIKSSNDLPIRLSPQQERILNASLPIFLQGIAGSGKTSVIAAYAHRQLLRSNNSSTILILAYTDQLKDFIISILRTLTIIDPVDLSMIKVCTWNQLCNNLTEQIGVKQFKWASELYFKEFLNLYLNKNNKKQDAFQIADDIQEYIRGVIKGHNLDSAIIDRQSFFNMASIPLDEKIKRTELYDLAQSYQYSLESKGLVDDSDAARRLLEYANIFHQFDFVLIDEIQDYTAIQMRLLSKLSKSVKGILFAGDMNQVLHPSFFSWEKVRSAVWSAWTFKLPEPIEISYNYRNPQPIIDITNTLMSIRLDRLGVKNNYTTKSNHLMTPRPIRLVAKQSDIDFLIKELASQIGSLAVIQKPSSISNKIEINNIAFERQFTPKTVKGLEFNVVCLVNFNELYQDLVNPSKTLSERQLLSKFNEVYVALTRTRKQLILLDRFELSSGLWEKKDLSLFYDFSENKESLMGLLTARFKNKSKADWEYDAEDFENQKAFHIAGECWERAGNPIKAAHSYAKAVQWNKVINIYKGLENYEEVAKAYERIGNKNEAALFYEKAGNLEYSANLFFQCGNFFKAANIYKVISIQNNTLHNWKITANCFSKAQQFESAADSYL